MSGSMVYFIDDCNKVLGNRSLNTHIQDKERQLHFAGAAVKIPHVQGKRNPRKTVGTKGGHQRADRLKLQSQTTSQSDRMDHSLV